MSSKGIYISWNCGKRASFTRRPELIANDITCASPVCLFAIEYAAVIIKNTITLAKMIVLKHSYLLHGSSPMKKEKGPWCKVTTCSELLSMTENDFTFWTQFREVPCRQGLDLIINTLPLQSLSNLLYIYDYMSFNFVCSPELVLFCYGLTDCIYCLFCRIKSISDPLPCCSVRWEFISFFVSLFRL